MSAMTRSRLAPTWSMNLIMSCGLCSLAVLGPFETRALASPQLPQGSQQQTTPPARKTTADKSKKNRKKRPPVSQPASSLCDAKMPVHSFVVDATGNVSDTGRSIEGPACVQVYFPAAHYKVSLAQVTTTTKGPDPSSVVLGTAPAAGGGSEKLTEKRKNLRENVSNRFSTLFETEKHLRGLLSGAKNEYNAALNDQVNAISAIKNMLQAEVGVDPTHMPLAVRNSYQDLQPVLRNALSHAGVFVPSDRAADGIAVLPALQDISTQLALLKVTFADGSKPDATNPPKCKPDLDNDQETRRIAFSDWYAHCKEAYDTVTQQVAADIQDAQGYVSAGDKVTQLKAKLAIVKYWDSLFRNIGLRTDMTRTDIDKADMAGAFVTATPVRCGTLFNVNTSTSVSVVSIDESPTLDGGSPTVKTQTAFVTITCASPLSITAGVAFSTIKQKEFAIIKSAGGAHNTSINKFGTISESRLHPLPLGMVHVRLAEWSNHKYAFHATFGVAGNIKGQASGGSAAEFLPGLSFSFWRAMYLSFGPHIGTQAKLAGGFNEGDVVPSDITTIQGQVKRSYTVGFGFAITFTKP